MNRPAILVSSALIALTACADPDAVVDPTDTAEVIFDVPSGASGTRVGVLLEEQGLVGSSYNFKSVLKADDVRCIKAGKHVVKKSMTVREIQTSLCAAPIPDDVPFTVLEGWRINDIDKALVAKGWIEPGAYSKLATEKSVEVPFEVTGPTLEGYLYPETYMVPPAKERFDAKRLIERQLATFKERFVDAHPDLGGRTLHDIVVVASMIEREEPTPKYRPVVSGIIWKRLDSDTALGIDATSRYKLENWEDEKAFRAVLKDPNDEYGTRVRTGLPPTAIGNPTLSSLEAALKPEKTEFWYYLHDKDGVFHGGRNGAEHEANRKKYSVY